MYLQKVPIKQNNFEKKTTADPDPYQHVTDPQHC